MKMRKVLYIWLTAALISCGSEQTDTGFDFSNGNGAHAVTPKGSLFIIGGGKRPASLMKAMVDMAEGDAPYALVFPQSSAEPDTSFMFIEADMAALTDMPIIKVGNAKLRTSLIDSVRAASLIFITGGDQRRFLDKVHPAVQNAVKEAYIAGAVVAGTSAGAALMSKVMITGDQREQPTYESTYSSLHHKNGIYAEGLSLLDSIIIDQHFVVRSRYNRLISALADTGYPYAVGVDEATAFVVAPDYYTVVGEGQVVVFQRPDSFTQSDGRIGLRNMKMNLYLDGDTFKLDHR